VAVRDGWIIYAIFGVLVCLLLWRVATQWNVKSAEAENLRASLIILGVVALAFVVWQFVQQASPIAVDSQDKTITVFAAASMTNALDDVDAAFTKQTGVKVVTSYDASSALMKQIEGGTPADAFVSANLKWMDHGVEKRVTSESTRINLLGNVLVLIAAKDSKIDHVDIIRVSISPSSRAMVGSQPATSRRSRSGSTPRPLWKNSAYGRPSSRKWLWRSMSEPLWPTSPAARRRSASSMRPMPRSSPA
jgi:hypothetical protein